MQVYRQELRTFWRTTLAWMGTLAGALIVFLGLYPAFSRETGALMDMVSGFGSVVQTMLGMNLMVLGNITGFYGFLFLYVALCGGIQAMVLGVSIVSRERRNKTTDFLFAKPLSRLRIYGEKLLAALTLIVATNIVFIAVALAMGRAMQGSVPFETGVFLRVTLCMLWTQLFFVALGFFVAVLSWRLKSPFSVSLSGVFGLFIISMVSTLTEDDLLRFLTPFRYFDATYVVMHGGYHAATFITGLALTAALAAGGLWIACKRDIPAAA